MRTSVCSVCRAPIVWAATKNGKAAPFDAEPSSVGTFELRDSSDPPVAVFVAPAARVAGDLLYVSHFGTCPKRESFRR